MLLYTSIWYFITLNCGEQNFILSFTFLSVKQHFYFSSATCLSLNQNNVSLPTLIVIIFYTDRAPFTQLMISNRRVCSFFLVIFLFWKMKIGHITAALLELKVLEKIIRCSRSWMFFKKVVIKNVTMFSRTCLGRGLFSIKLQTFTYNEIAEKTLQGPFCWWIRLQNALAMTEALFSSVENLYWFFKEYYIIDL